MTICTFCTLLCELENAEASACRLRERAIRRLASKTRNDPPRIAGHVVPLEKAINAANRMLQDSDERTITGNIRSVEGARAAIALAARIGAFVNPTNSVDAFHQIEAVQRSGMVAASMSEIRFRSDCIVLIGDDRILDSFPRICQSLIPRQENRLSSSPARMVAMGNWSSKGLEQLRVNGSDVCSIDIDVTSIPQSLFQWSRCGFDRQAASPNLASQWICQSKYLTVLWAPAILPMKQADLWIERLGQWIDQRNETARSVGFPMSGDYVTFQQVCTWTTGFPGRVHIDGENFRYDPHRRSMNADEESKTTSVAIQIDESYQERNWIAPDHVSTIVIGPAWDAYSNPPNVFIPCKIPGIDHKASFFRVDAAVAMEAEDSLCCPVSENTLSVSEILARLGDFQGC